MTVSMVRVVLEVTDNKIIRLKTSDIKEFRKIVGEDLVDCFFCCFVLADRITSLVDFIYLSGEKFGESIAGKRDRLNGCWFLIGILKELSLSLKNLKTAMVKANILDKDLWENGLAKWEKWADTKDVSLLRNEMAFHVAKDRMQAGLENIAPGEATIFYSDGKYRRNSRSELALDALLLGLQTDSTPKKAKADIEVVIKELSNYLSIWNQLEEEFLRVLKIKNLEPIISKVKGSKIVN